MLLQYASDLHLEFNENEDFIRVEQPLIPVADTLVLAGDITTFRDQGERRWFFDWVSENFKQTYWVPGNHEYYHFDLADKRGSFCEAIRSNVFLVNDHAVTIDNARLIFATLWTNVSPRNQIAVERGMNDFHLIRLNGHRLTCDDLRIEHEKSLAFIEFELLQEHAGLRKVVVTHHVPTLLHYPPKYLHSPINEGFAVELKQFISEFKPDHWIYGHHHQNIPEFLIGDTKMLTNQLGYVKYGEHKLFDPAKLLVIPERV